jgi:hypothetical protein
MIGGDDGGGAGREQLLEQAQLGGTVRIDRGMIVEVIARQIGETAERDANAVEAMLIESVR